MNEEVKKERFTSYLPLDLINKLRETSETTGIPQTKLIERAMEDYLAKMEEQKKFFEKL